MTYFLYRVTPDRITGTFYTADPGTQALTPSDVETFVTSVWPALRAALTVDGVQLCEVERPTTPVTQIVTVPALYAHSQQLRSAYRMGAQAATATVDGVPSNPYSPARPAVREAWRAGFLDTCAGSEWRKR